jgi:hypothetical protein
MAVYLIVANPVHPMSDGGAAGGGYRGSYAIVRVTPLIGVSMKDPPDGYSP